MSAFQKDKPWRSEKYLKWIRTQPCILCGAEAEPHHIRGVGLVGGMAQKADDIATIPLCRKHHDAMHRTGENWGQQWELALRTVINAVRDGAIKA